MFFFSYVCPMKNEIEFASKIFKQLSNPKRLNLVYYLREKKKATVNEMCENASCEQSLVSHTLKKMKKVGILDCKKEGRNVYYFLKNNYIINAIDIIVTNLKTK